MSAAYTFDLDPSRHCIRLRMSGFFSLEELPGFLDTRRAVHARLTCTPNSHVTLADIREMKIQSQDMVEGFGRVLGDASFHARRLAFVISPGLLRTQLVRAVGRREDVRCFDSVRAAEAWLFTANIEMPIRKSPGTNPLSSAP